jgi:signal transduction histidine kinase
MNIKFKLSLRFTLIVATILFGSFYMVYQNYATFRQVNFYERLTDRAQYITNAMIEYKELDDHTIQTLNNYTLSISPNLQLSLFDLSGKLIQPIGTPLVLNDQLLKQLQTKGSFEIQVNDTQYVGFKDTKHDGTIYVMGAAYDRTGYKKLDFLQNLFIIIWIIGVVTTAIVGWLFAKVSLHPMTEVVDEVQKITAHELHKRLSVRNSKDEIAHLSRTFNNMLNRLEASFALQKDFVSNASHEFRTPLTSMKGQIQVALLKERSPHEYHVLLQSLNDDINNIISLLNALQELAKANAEFPLKAFYPVPVLDTLIDAQNELIRNKPQYKIDITVGDFQEESIDAQYCNGDLNLLKSAFTNLMDNGCKFSLDYSVKVKIRFYNQHIWITFSDEGVGIDPTSIVHIFEPFYRGNDTRNVYGHGIGLSLVKRIIEWHKGHINVESEPGKGTIFTLELPNIKAKYQGKDGTSKL